MLLIKESITLEKIKNSNLFIIGGPKKNFTSAEFEALHNYMDNGGSVLILTGEGGEEK